jgi:hypothetical protein
VVADHALLIAAGVAPKRPEWTTLLEANGLQVSSRPMSRGTPLANPLMVAVGQ